MKELIKTLIVNRRFEQDRIEKFWSEFKKYSRELKFDEAAYSNIQAKVSSHMAYLEESIQDNIKKLK